MSKTSVDGSGILKWYDHVTGIFNEIFDSRLLTVSLLALEGYCVLFTQRKFTMRWSQMAPPVAPEKPTHAVDEPSASSRFTLRVNDT